MNLYLLVVIVVSQIAIFQFLSPLFTRSLLTVRLGAPSPPLSDAVADYVRRARRHRYLLGGAFVLAALLGGLGMPTDTGIRKLVLAATSLASTAAFIVATISDRRAVGSLGESLPDAGVRRASLEPRSIRQWYHPAWEIVPIAILAVTSVFTVWLGRHLGYIPAGVAVYHLLLGAFVLGALFYTHRYGTATPNVALSLAMFRGRPQMALMFGERLVGEELRYFMKAKIGVALLLAVAECRHGLSAINHEYAPTLRTAGWVIVAALLVLFAQFLLQLFKLVREALEESPA